MGQIKIGENMPRFRIDNEYETWRTDKEYWVDKFNEIKDSYELTYPDQQTLADLRYKLHRWQMYVNMAFNIQNRRYTGSKTKITEWINKIIDKSKLYHQKI